MKWISLEDKRPTEAGRYLVVTTKGEVLTKNYSPRFENGYECDGFAVRNHNGKGFYKKSNVLYWAPCPELPEELRLTDEEKSAPKSFYPTIRKLRAENERLKRLLKERA